MEKSFDLDPLGQYSTGDEAPAPLDIPDSPSSAADAGVDDDLQELTSVQDFDASVEEGDDIIEIPSADLDIEALDDPVTRDTIRSPDMDAPDTPGQIDIEALGDHDLDGTDLPADARLDPLED